ncbi:MAG: T9SS type A sorting domain-containing protein, partial [Cytophagales bacterium]|nr:T9SS type A sorting domain-containing protein [Cytophagales bacterium]
DNVVASSICNGASADLEFTLTGASPWTISISDGSDTQVIGGITDPDFIYSVSPNTTTTYELTNIIDGNGCSQAVTSNNTKLITVNSLPTAVISGTATICNGESTNLTVNLTGGSDWDFEIDGVSYTDETSPFTVSVSTAKTYTVSNITSDEGCTTSAGTGSAIVTVNPLPAVSFTNLKATYDTTELRSVISGNPTGIGGVLSGDVEKEGNVFYFNPKKLGLGTYVVQYDYTDANGCTNTIINYPQVVSGGNFLNGNSKAIYCSYNAPETLTTNLAGGTFTVNTLTPTSVAGFTLIDPQNLQFNPSLMANGNYIITYTKGAVELNVEFRVEVIGTVDFSFGTGDNEYCADEGLDLLTAITPPGGEGRFTGPTGILNLGKFANLNPSEFTNFSTQTINFEYTSDLGCKRDIDKDVTVYELPTVGFDLASVYNITDAEITLTADAPNNTGFFTVNGITNTSFDPSDLGVGGPYEVRYSYTDGNGCSNDSIIEARVVQATAEIQGLNPLHIYCYEDGAVDLVGVPDINNNNGDPGVFTYTGLDVAIESTGTNTARFYPNRARSGTDTLIFTYTQSNLNPFTIKEAITIDSIGDVFFTGLDTAYCVDRGNVLLEANIVPGEDGQGFFSGPIGVSDIGVDRVTGKNEGLIIPQILKVYSTDSLNVASEFEIVYTYTRDFSGCFKSDTQKVTVNPLPEVGFDLASIYNVADAPITLVADAPNDGGSFIVNGTPNALFDPSDLGVGGPYEVRYSYTDRNMCTNDTSLYPRVVQATAEIQGLNPLHIYCYEDGAVDLVGVPDVNNNNGDPGVFTYTGRSIAIDSTGINTARFYPNRAGSGTDTLIFTYTQSNLNSFTIREVITVDSIGNIGFRGLDAAYCIDAGNVPLEADTVPGESGTGLFSGPIGLSDIGFNDSTRKNIGLVIPQVLKEYSADADNIPSDFKIVYTYTRDFSGCSKSDTQSVRINPLPNPNFTIRPIFNVEEDSVLITGAPSGGTFSGIGMGTSNYFFPKRAGVGGPYEIKYEVTDLNSCYNKKSLFTEVTTGLVNVLSIKEDKDRIYCYYGDVNDTLAVTKLNGDGSYGAFVTQNGLQDLGNDTLVLTPKLLGQGTHTIQYTYTGDDGNTFPYSFDIIVDSIGDINFDNLAGAYCANDGEITLESNVNLTAKGGDGGNGAFSGLGEGLFNAGESALFFPSLVDTAVVNPHEVVYTYTSPLNCKKSVMKEVIVHPLPELSFTIRSAYNVTEAEDVLIPNVLGGTFTGSGIQNGNEFVPEFANIGTHDITYTYTDGNNCTNSVINTVSVVEANGYITGIDSARVDDNTWFSLYCYDAPLDTIVGVPVDGLPGGEFTISSDSGITEIGLDIIVIDPALVGEGIHILNYTYKDAAGISYTISEEIIIDSIGDVSFIGLEDAYCIDEDSITLVALTFADGTNTFTGPSGFTTTNEVLTSFTPKDVGVGKDHKINFEYTAPSGCSKEYSKLFTVHDLPNVSFDLKPLFNIEDENYFLNPTPNPLLDGGSYSFEVNYQNSDGTEELQPRAIAGLDFILSALDSLGEYKIRYTFTDTTNTGCTNSIVDTTEVTAADARISGINDPEIYCYDDSPSILTADILDHIQPVNFYLEGRGIKKDTVLADEKEFIYDPKLAGAGKDTVRLVYEVEDDKNNITKFQVEVVVEVDSISTELNFVGLSSEYCEDEVADELTPSITNGTFYGSTGIDGNFFNPQNAKIGIDTIFYSYTSPLGCTKEIDKVVEVRALPNVSFSFEKWVCENEGSQTIEGWPRGGTFTGTVSPLNGQVDSVRFNPQDLVGENVIEYEYEDQYGCSSKLSDTVFVRAIPQVSILDLAQDYCEDAGLQTITASVVTVGGGTGLFTGGEIVDDNNTDTIAVFDPALLQTDSLYTITFEYTDDSSCVNSVSKQVSVNALPIVSFNGLIEDVYCSKENALSLKGVPSVQQNTFGEFRVHNLDSNTVTTSTGDEYLLALGNLYDGDFVVSYHFTDQNNCADALYDTITIHPSPSPGFFPETNCITDTIIYRDTTFSTDNIVKWEWNFLTANAQDTVQNPKFLYETPGEKSVTLTVTTENNCVASIPRSSGFGAKPTADFTWNNECFDEENPTITYFENTSNDDIFNVTGYVWNFGIEGATASTEDGEYTYTVAKTYDVSLIMNTFFGCADTSTQKVHIRPYIRTYPYKETFEEGTGGWFAEAEDTTNISWELGYPKGRDEDSLTLNVESNVWITSLSDNYSRSELSYVVGPCFDMSSLIKPMIKVNIWSNLESNDGVVFQYTIDNSSDAKWNTIGDLNDMIAWYNGFSIQADPGGKQTGIAWTGETNGWIEARHSLDEIIDNHTKDELEYVRFRFAFASNEEGQQKGFAFDNVWIGDRERVVLVEHFTNMNTSNITTVDNQINAVIGGNELDVTDIRYHTDHNEDALNKIAPEEVSARELYYSNPTPPYTITDGNQYRGTSLDWLAEDDLLQERILSDPLFEANVTSRIENGKLKVTVFAQSDSIFEDDIYVRIAVIEETVQEGSRIFNNVMRTMLPDAPGTQLSSSNYINGINLYYSWEIPDYVQDSKNLRVVAFIQNNRTKEVYQAMDTDKSEILLSVEEGSINTNNEIIIYPNPSSEYLTIYLTTELTEDLQYELVDVMGDVVTQGVVEAGTQKNQFETSEYTAGMYVLRITYEDGTVIQQKVVIYH